MTYPLSDIKAALLAWLGTESGGQTVIFQHQSKRSPAAPFISVNVPVNIAQVGMQDHRFYSESGEYLVLQHRETMISINAHGPAALATLAACRDALQRWDRYDTYFKKRGLSCRCLPVVNLTGIKGAQYEERAQMDCYISSGHVLTETVETIGSVNGLDISAGTDSVEVTISEDD